VSFYPAASPSPSVLAGEGDLPAGVMAAVRLGDVIWPLSRLPRAGDRSAAVIAGTARIRAGEQVVFFKPVAVATARVRRDGQVQAAGSPCDHARLGVLEERLDVLCGPGTIDALASRVKLSGPGKKQRTRLLAAGFVIRVLLLMTLMPAAPVTEVMDALAGDLAMVPWERAWHRPSRKAFRAWCTATGPRPLEDLRDMVLRSSCAEHREHDWSTTLAGGLRPWSGDGTLIRVPDTPANRAAFGSSGTADDSAPWPQLRAELLPDVATRAVLAVAAGPAGTDKAAAEQALLDQAMTHYPHAFTMDRIVILDRNYPGAKRIAKLMKRTHVLIRLKSDIPLTRVSGFFPDGSYLAETSGDGVTVTVRVIEYDVEVEGQDVPETFCLITDLHDWQAHPGAELAAPYKWRFLSALGASAGVGVSSARAGVGCRNVAVAVGSVSHGRIGVVNECAGNHLLRGARGSRDACASWVPGCEEGPAVAVGGLLISVRGRCSGRVQAVWRPLARMIAAVTRRMLVWSRLPRQQARWTGMRWSARLAAIRIMLIADPAAPIRRASIAAMTSSQWM
jgi:hypothetical protein